MFFVLSRGWDREKILSPQEESTLRPSDSALRCSTTETQRLYGERGLLRSSHNTRPAYCWDQQCRQFVNKMREMVSFELVNISLIYSLITKLHRHLPKRIPCTCHFVGCDMLVQKLNSTKKLFNVQLPREGRAL